MKKDIPLIIAFCIVAIITIASCQKDYNKNGQNNNSASLNLLFSDLRTTPQSFSVQAGRDTVVYGSQGTKLHFYSNSFKDMNGNIITGGILNIQLVEMYKPGDMIRERATTMTTDGQPLQSGGQINMVVTLNGQEVLSNGYGIGFIQQSASAQQMNLFYGSNTNADSTITWMQDHEATGTIAPATISDTTYTGTVYYNNQYYFFTSCPNFHESNCDRFRIDDSPRVSVSVIVPDASFYPSNTQIYLVVPSINCVASSANAHNTYSGYSLSTNTIQLICEDNPLVIATGMNYELVVIANKNGNYYYFETSGTATREGIVAHAIMESKSKDDIISMLQSL